MRRTGYYLAGALLDGRTEHRDEGQAHLDECQASEQHPDARWARPRLDAGPELRDEGSHQECLVEGSTRREPLLPGTPGHSQQPPVV